LAEITAYNVRMPYASEERVRQVQEILSGKVQSLKLKLLQQQPIHPPDDGSQNWVQKAPTGGLDFRAPSKPNTAGDYKLFSKLKLTDALDRIGFIRFEPETGVEVGAITFKVKYARELKKRADRVGYIPIWFLPWRSGHMVKIKIEEVDLDTAMIPSGVTGIDPLPNPSLFFTAAINGCSVFVTGSAKHPSLYHGGMSGASVEEEGQKAFGETVFNSVGGTAEAVWREVLEGVWHGRDGKLIQKPAIWHNDAKLKKDKGFIGEVNKSDYVTERSGSDFVKYYSPMMKKEFKTTQIAADFQKHLEQNQKDSITEVDVNAWGCVFGLRDSGGAWAFYLQKNASVIYQRWVKKKFGLISYGRKAAGELMPMTSGSSVLREQPIRTCVNLGNMQFFPQRSSVQVRAFNSVQVF
jgi:hypothetical protein